MTTTQPSLFDDSIEAAYEAANGEWVAEAERYLVYLAKHYRHFASDDIMIHLNHKGLRTHENRAIGAIFRRAERDGLIRADGFRISARREQHGHPIRVWRSLIYKESE